MKDKTLNKKKSLSLMGICAIMLASSITVMVGTAIISAVPEIAVRYGLPLNLSSWLITVPALGVIAGAVPFGRLIDRIGAYRVCIIGLAFYGIFGITGFLMPGICTLFVSRFLLGVATAAVMTSGTALISEFYHGDKRLRMIAVQGMALEIGGIVFLSLGGFLAEISWRGPFFIYAIGFVSLLWIYCFVPSPGKRLLPEISEQDAAKTLPPRNRNIWPVVALAFVAAFIFFSGIVSLPVHLQHTLGHSPSFTGNFLAFVSIMAVVAAGIMPKIVSKLTPKGCLCAAFVSYALSYGLFTASVETTILLVAAMLLGIGFGLTIPLINHLTVERSKKENIGRNLALYSIMTSLGQFLSSLLTTLDIGYSPFMVIAVMAVVAFFGTLAMFRN